MKVKLPSYQVTKLLLNDCCPVFHNQTEEEEEKKEEKWRSGNLGNLENFEKSSRVDPYKSEVTKLPSSF